MSYDKQGYLPAGLAPTQPFWSQPNNTNQPNVNEYWEYGVPVGKWNMTSFNYDQWANQPGQPVNNRFCALNSEDFFIDHPPGYPKKQYGNLFPSCYTRQSDVALNRNFFKVAQDIDVAFAAGKFDAVSEINHSNPSDAQPCHEGRTLIEMLLPAAAAIAAGIVSGILMGYAVPANAPQVFKPVGVLGSAAFGWEFGSAINEGDTQKRRELFRTCSAIAGVTAGSMGAVMVTYVFSDAWQTYEIPILAFGAATGYFFLAPLILPAIDNFGVGIIGYVWRFVDGVLGFFGGLACGIANWGIDGCTKSVNPQARSWDRILLSSAAVQDMARNFDMDEKEKEVAFQALTLNAASWSVYQDPYNVANQVASYDSERSWNGVKRSPLEGGDGNQNAYSPFGPIVQANWIHEPQWWENMYGTGVNIAEFYWGMYPKPDEDKNILQKCDTAEKLLGNERVRKWMDNAYTIAQHGKSQPYPVGLPKEIFGCESAMSYCLQQPSAQAAGELADVLLTSYRDVFDACKKNPEKRKFSIWWQVFLEWGRESRTAPQYVIGTNVLLVDGLKLTLENEHDVMKGVVEIFRKFGLDRALDGHDSAKDIWVYWLYCASDNRNAPLPLQPTVCDKKLDQVQEGSPTIAQLGQNLLRTGYGIGGCDAEQAGKMAAYRRFETDSCDDARKVFQDYFTRVPPTNEAKCGIARGFLQGSDFSAACSAETQDIVQQWVAACSQ